MKRYLKKQTSLIISLILVIISCALIIRIVAIESKNNRELNKEFIFNPKLHTSDTLYIKKYTDKPFIIYFADPECDACAYEIMLLSKIIDKIVAQYYILFITERNNSKMVVYLEKLHIYPNSEVFIGMDDFFKISDYYKVEHVPTILLLDKNFIARKKLSTLRPLLDNL